ncbi:uncharacterized protein SRS1_13901 [Sporisorium reilianum f. sp. reilianum]|uniref:Uncharacterized protein n=1 Tax=Sporisorium reilianum f. sp. reilianum TaxID=72559 RepID=A0A2N8UDL7_9BASI|nr:uncharacterized protein SRS1_13901 [Sporisorium reilianum f. sp. reilianum]
MKLHKAVLLFAAIALHCALVVKAVKDDEVIVSPDLDPEKVRFSLIHFEKLRHHVKPFYQNVAIPMWREKKTVTGAHWNQYLRGMDLDPTEPEVILDELMQKIREDASKAHP